MISVEKVFKQNQCAKVDCSSDDAENDCQPIWWGDEDLWYFHGVGWLVGWLCQRRLTGINLRHDLTPVDIYFAEKRNDFEIPYSTRLAEQK